MGDAVFLIAWFIAGFIDAGFSYAYLQRAFPRVAIEERRRDTLISLLFVIGGPGSLIASYVRGWTKHGWLFPGSKP